MRTSDITVYIYKGARAPRHALLLAPEVAASFGWANGAIISQTEAMQAIMVNSMYRRDCIKEQRKQEEAR